MVVQGKCIARLSLFHSIAVAFVVLAVLPLAMFVQADDEAEDRLVDQETERVNNSILAEPAEVWKRVMEVNEAWLDPRPSCLHYTLTASSKDPEIRIIS